jgi:acyl-CoA thioester hydrolase
MQASHTHPLRVYWEDTDAGGVVFYANYLKFFERARTEWLRALGVEQQALRDAQRLIFIVTATELRYLAPARLDDELTIVTTLAEPPRATFVFAQRALRGDVVLTEGRITVACVDAGTFAPKRLPTNVVERLLLPA